MSQNTVFYGLPWWLSGKEPFVHLGDVGSVPGSGRCPGEGNSNLLQYSCLGNHMDRGVWQAIVHGVTKELDMTWQLNNNKDLLSLQWNIGSRASQL